MDDEDEYPLLNEPNVMLVTLRTAARGPVTPEECVRELEANLLKAQETPPADEAMLRRRVAVAFRYLCVAGLLDPDETGRCTITERGTDMLWSNPNGIDSSILMAFPEFRSHVCRPNALSRSAGEPGAAEPTPQFDEGFEAYHARKGLTDNPYEFDTFAHLEWENGWCEARDVEAEPERQDS